MDTNTIIAIVAIFVTTVISIFLGIGIFRRIISAEPNEWMLIIQNGKLVKSGIGLRAFKGLRQTIVNFPASVSPILGNFVKFSIMVDILNIYYT